MPYNLYTYDSPRLLQRASHRKRFRRSLALVRRYATLARQKSFLDYGCADGHLAAQVSESIPGLTVMCYDPYPDDSPVEGMKIHTALDGEIAAGAPYGIIGCFEVLEHLSPSNQKKAIDNIRSLLADDGFLILSVPVEGGIPGAFKGLFRKIFDRRLAPQYTLRNTLRTLLRRPMPEFRQSDGYLDHIGFYFKDLEKILENHFILKEISYSPLGIGREALNAQILAVYTPATRR